MPNSANQFLVSKRPALLQSQVWLVTLVVLAGFGLRVWGLDFGLPHAYHIDEPTYVSAALNLGSGQIGRQPNPTGFSNILFGEYAAYYVLGRAAGWFSSAAQFERAYRTDPSAFFLLSRLTSALFGAAAVAVVYALGRALRGHAVGLAAAVLMAVSFLHGRDAHYGVPDVAVTFWVALSVWGGVRAVQTGVLRWYLLAALAAGLAVTTKWSTWLVALPLALSLLSLRSSRPGASASAIRVFGLVVVAGVLGFALGGFQLLLKPQVYLEYALRELASGKGGGFGVWQIDTVSGYQFYLQNIQIGMGWLVSVLAGVGLLVALRRARSPKTVLTAVFLAFPLAYFLFMGSTRHYFARYTLPLLPFVAVLAALAAGALAERLRTAAWRTPALAALALAAALQPAASLVRHNWLLTQTDTRTLASAWIEANLPEGSRIALDWPVHGPPLQFKNNPIPGAQRTYDVTLVGQSGLAAHPLNWYSENGYEYLITSSSISELDVIYPNVQAQRQAFYAALDEERERVYLISPLIADAPAPFVFDEMYGPYVSLWQRERPGPMLAVYRLPAAQP